MLCLLQLSVYYGVILSGAWLLGSRGVSVLWRISDIRRHTPGPTPTCCVHNVIIGKLWIEQYGTVEILNHRPWAQC